jgi:hypothetical protein
MFRNLISIENAMKGLGRATVSTPIVAEICARRGAGFSRFLQLVPGEGESHTTGKLWVLHFFDKKQLDIASFCDGTTEVKVGVNAKF